MIKNCRWCSAEFEPTRRQLQRWDWLCSPCQREDSRRSTKRMRSWSGVDLDESLRTEIDSLIIPVTESGCWIWLGAVDHGYGGLRGRRMHRVMWEMECGEIPKGMCVCHRCDVPLCVNPDHLFLGTHADNMADMARKGRSANRKNIGRLTKEEIRTIQGSQLSVRRLAMNLGRAETAVRYWRLKAINHPT